MYRCQLCGALVPPGSPARRVIVETRTKSYPKREKAYRIPDRTKPGHWLVPRDDPGGEGTEIAREVLACQRCADRWQQPKGPDDLGGQVRPR